MKSEAARFIQWNDGYKDGYRQNKEQSKDIDYIAGYRKGTADKQFSDTYSDEAIGIYGGFDG
jgi:hypothetical protein